MMPVVTNSLKAKMEICTVWKSENTYVIRPKATPMVEGKAERTKNVFDVGVLVKSEQIAEQRVTLMEDTRNLHPKEKVLEVARKKSKKHRKTCHWRPFGVL